MRSKIEIGRQGNFILACLLIHFVFFGYISNIFEKSVGQRLIFLYQVLFNPSSMVSFIILFIIIFFMMFRENFYEYGIRNSIWLLPIIIFMSWFWYWLIYGFDITIIGIFFIRIEGYLTLLSLLSIIIFTAILAAYAKEKYELYLQKVKKVTINR